MLEDVTGKLSSIGYTITGDDEWMLSFIIQKVETEIKVACGTDAVPDGLHEVAVDMVAGEFLFEKKSAGQLTGFDLEVAEKQVQEGDTTVVYAIGNGSKTPEQRLDALITYLMTYGKERFASFRSIGW